MTEHNTPRPSSGRGPVEEGLAADLSTRSTVAAAPTSLPASTEVAPQSGAVATQELIDGGARVSKLFILGICLATFGVMLAYILPSAFSLSVVINRLAPGKEEILGGLVATGSLASMLAGPAVGVWSDRTRSRFGRRRLFLLGGFVVGFVGLVILGVASNIGLLFVGWIVGALGLGTTVAALLNVQADRLPESQRGRVASLTGFATMVAPILGVGLAFTVVSSQLLLFAVPGLIAGVFVVIFGLFLNDPDTRQKQLAPLSFGAIAAKYLFNPRTHPAYGWNWAGRLVFFLGISGSTTFTTFFFAQRLGVQVDQVAGVIAAVSLIGIVGGVVGGIGAGFLSDRLKRRRIFILVGAIFFTGGSVAMAFASDLPALAVGMLITNLGIGAFTAVDQAIVLDVLPDRDTDTGRYMALMTFSQGIPQVIAPLVAGLVITIGATADQKNYALLYLLSGIFALVGAAIVFFKVKAVR